jgi:hypothetical protein
MNEKLGFQGKLVLQCTSTVSIQTLLKGPIKFSGGIDNTRLIKYHDIIKPHPTRYSRGFQGLLVPHSFIHSFIVPSINPYT